MLIAEDRRQLRHVLQSGLRRFDDIEVVGEAENGASAVEQALALRPDVVLMDLKMPGGDGIAATGAIRGACPMTQVLVLTTRGDAALVRKAAAAGATGFVLNDITIESLVAVVRAVHQGDIIINPGIVRELLDEGALTAVASGASVH